MWINISAVGTEIFLELFVFILLCLTVYKGFHAWGKPLLLQLLYSFKKHRQDLATQIHHMKNTCQTVESDLAEHKQQLATIQQKLERWHQGRIEEQQKKIQEQMHTLTVITTKKKKQREELAQTKLRSLVIPQAVMQASTELEQKLTGKQGKDLLDELIINITKRSSS